MLAFGLCWEKRRRKGRRGEAGRTKRSREPAASGRDGAPNPPRPSCTLFRRSRKGRTKIQVPARLSPPAAAGGRRRLRPCGSRKRCETNGARVNGGAPAAGFCPSENSALPSISTDGRDSPAPLRATAPDGQLGGAALEPMGRANERSWATVHGEKMGRKARLPAGFRPAAGGSSLGPGGMAPRAGQAVAGRTHFRGHGPEVFFHWPNEKEQCSNNVLFKPTG